MKWLKKYWWVLAIVIVGYLWYNGTLSNAAVNSGVVSS